MDSLLANVVNAKTVNGFNNAYDWKFGTIETSWMSEADELVGPVHTISVTS